MSGTQMERRLRISGILLILGLAIEAFSFIGKGPIGFLIFASFGFGLVGLAILLFLYSLVSVSAGVAPANRSHRDETLPAESRQLR
jgi:hypothetical protein